MEAGILRERITLFAQRHRLEPEIAAELAALLEVSGGSDSGGPTPVLHGVGRGTPEGVGQPAPVGALEHARRAPYRSPSSRRRADSPPVERVTLSLEPLQNDLAPLANAARRVQAMGLVTPPFPLPERYIWHCLLGRGGMGEVHRVYDRYLNRTMALKVLQDRWVEEGASRDIQSRFLAEAQATAQLQHPGIVPVHDIGRLEDGRHYFTMREVHGQTLADLIREVHLASPGDRWETSARGWTFRRLIDTFHKLCEAMAYAHERGVVHRDLKPSNIMVGRYGEVLVMDWGLAKVAGSEERAGVEEELQPVHTVRTEAGGLETRVGRVAGTVLYMPPEQARGEVARLGPWSDVYSLGAVLYEILSGAPPYGGSDRWEVLKQVARGEWRRPVRRRLRPETESGTESLLGGAWTLERTEVVGGPPLPDELVGICERAMNYVPEARYADSGALAEAVWEWLEQARRRERGLAALGTVGQLPAEIEALREAAQVKRAEARMALAGVKSWEPEERKYGGWVLEDEAERLEREVDLKTIGYTQGLRGALSQDPELAEAHQALAGHYAVQHRVAEAMRDERSAAQWELLLRSHDRAGQYAKYLKGDGAVTVLTDPPGANVTLYRYVTCHRRLVPEWVKELGRTPIRGETLERGSYLLKVAKEGYAPVRYPVFIGRGEHWDGVAPGDRSPTPIWLPPQGLLGPEDCYVPAGWFWAGGDREAVGAVARQHVWVDGVVVRKFPVTNREYLVFLNDLVRQGRDVEALRHAPRERPAQYGQEGAPLYGRDNAGQFFLQKDADGDVWDPEWPVTHTDWVCAMAFAMSLSDRTSCHWRLLGELEWEKAARGVDGRSFPWGEGWDASWACTRESHNGRPVGQVVDSYPLDESVYGIRGMGGNLQDWCQDEFRDEGATLLAGRYEPPNLDEWLIRHLQASGQHTMPQQRRCEQLNSYVQKMTQAGSHRVVRGGHWNGIARLLRCANRFRGQPGHRNEFIGFRLASSAPDGILPP